MIELRGVTKYYGKGADRRFALNCASARFESKKHYVVFGARMSGKSTLLKLISGLLRPPTGWIKRDGLVSLPLGTAAQLASNRTALTLLNFLSTLYDADAREVLATTRMLTGWPPEYFNLPVRSLSIEARAKLSYAVGHALPADTYLVDGTISSGDEGFRARCQAVFEKRARHAGIIVVTRDFRAGNQLGEFGCVLEAGKIVQFQSVNEALAYYHHVQRSRGSFGLDEVRRLIALGERSTARSYLESILASGQPDVAALVLLSDLAYADEDYQEARSAATSALQSDPGSITAQLSLARVADAQGDTDTAITFARLAAQHSTSKREANQILARALEKAGLFREAGAAWREVAALGGGSLAMRLARRNFLRAEDWLGLVSVTPHSGPNEDPIFLARLRFRAAVAQGSRPDLNESFRRLVSHSPDLAVEVLLGSFAKLGPQTAAALVHEANQPSRTLQLTASTVSRLVKTLGDALNIATAQARTEDAEALKTIVVAFDLDTEMADRASEQIQLSLKSAYAEQALTALSRSKPTRASSIWGDWVPSLGVDGDVKSPRKFFHTKRESNPWWEVDLERVANIKHIILFDKPQGIERAATLTVDVGVNASDMETIYDRSRTPFNGETETLIKWTGFARYVRLRLQEVNILHMRQVSVVGEYDDRCTAQSPTLDTSIAEQFEV